MAVNGFNRRKPAKILKTEKGLHRDIIFVADVSFLPCFYCFLLLSLNRNCSFFKSKLFRPLKVKPKVHFYTCTCTCTCIIHTLSVSVSETNFQDFSRTPKFTLTQDLNTADNCFLTYILVEFNRFPELSRTFQDQ